MLESSFLSQQYNCLQHHPQAMNQQAENLQNDSVGPKALTALTPLLAIGILFYAIRIYTRVVPKYKLNAADWACTMAVVRTPLSPLR
jgi:hypothetical protein